jgi:hypothetical protein
MKNKANVVDSAVVNGDAEESHMYILNTIFSKKILYVVAFITACIPLTVHAAGLAPLNENITEDTLLADENSELEAISMADLCQGEGNDALADIFCTRGGLPGEFFNERREYPRGNDPFNPGCIAQHNNSECTNLGAYFVPWGGETCLSDPETMETKHLRENNAPLICAPEELIFTKVYDCNELCESVGKGPGRCITAPHFCGEDIDSAYCACGEIEGE